MENLDDIRREEGNPRAQKTAGRPRSIFNFFGASSGPRLIAMLLLVLGALFLIIGAITFIAPLVMVGLAVVIIAGLGCIWARPKQTGTA